MTDRKRNNLLLILSLAAGCVDTIAFLNTATFPANMTGNSVMLGLALVQGNTIAATLSVLALMGFSAGVIVGAMLMPAGSGDRRWTPNLSRVLLGSGVLLIAGAVVLKFLNPERAAWMLIPTAIAMGMQSAAVLRLGVSGVSTTVITGTLTTALVRLTNGFQKKGGSVPDATEKPWLPLLSWIAYFVGALAGGIQSAWNQAWIFGLPGLLIVGVAIAAGIGQKSR